MNNSNLTEYERLEIQYLQMKHDNAIHTPEYLALKLKYKELVDAAKIVVETTKPFVEDMIGIASSARPTMGDIENLSKHFIPTIIVAQPWNRYIAEDMQRIESLDQFIESFEYICERI